MTGLLIGLAVLGSMGFFVLAFLSLLTKLCEKRIPRPIFRWFLAPFWLYRPKADVGSLLAMAFDTNPENFKLSGYSDDMISGTLGGQNFHANLHVDGRANVTIGNVHSVPITAWGDSRLYNVVCKLRKNKRGEASASRNAGNKQRYIEGTRLAAQLLAKEVQASRPDVITVEVIGEFETKARYLQARRVDNFFSNMLLPSEGGYAR